jgi:hypothetical protein
MRRLQGSQLEGFAIGYGPDLNEQQENAARENSAVSKKSGRQNEKHEI